MAGKAISTDLVGLTDSEIGQVDQVVLVESEIDRVDLVHPAEPEEAVNSMDAVRL